MNTALQHTSAATYNSSTRVSVWSGFIAWCKKEEKNRFMWLSIALAGHGCFLTPVTLMAVMLSGNLMLFWGLAIGAMAMVLITNLAALPTKITIPVLFLSLLIDLGVIISSIVIPLAAVH